MRGITVVQRIFIGFSLLAVVLIGIGGLSLNTVNQLVAKNEAAYGELLPLESAAQKLPQSLYRLQNALNQYLFEDTQRDPAGVSSAVLLVSERLQELKDRIPAQLDVGQQVSLLEPQIDAVAPNIDAVLAQYDQLAALEEARAILLASFLEDWQSELSQIQRLQVGATGAVARFYRQFDRLAGPVEEFVVQLSDTLTIEQAQEAQSVIAASYEAMGPIIERVRGQGGEAAMLSTIRNKLGNLLNDEAGFSQTHSAWLQGQRELLQRLALWQANVDEADLAIIALAEQVERFAQAEQAAMRATASSVQRWTLISIVLAILAALVTGWRTVQSIRKPLNNTLEALEQVSDGKFTVRLEADKRDEFSRIGALINHLTQSLASSITELRKNAQSLDGSATQSQDQANTAQQQAEHQRDQSQSIATAVNQMESAVHEVATSTNHARDEVDQVKVLANQGEQSMQENIATIEQLDQRISAASDVITKLAQQTDQITQILDVIGGIAEQTNLLALNAAIEAARAGESGRGFAVVADEVRSLADKTHQSTGEIQQMIHALMDASSQAKTYMQDASESMSDCVEQSRATAQSMQEIDSAMATVQGMSMQIATAAEQQTVVAKDINKNIVEVADLAELAYERAIKGSESSQYVKELAQQQNKLIQQFEC